MGGYRTPAVRSRINVGKVRTRTSGQYFIVKFFMNGNNNINVFSLQIFQHFGLGSAQILPFVPEPELKITSNICKWFMIITS